MAEVNGKLVTCDRCGKQIFLQTIGDGETDGGFTRWNKFENYPDGWDVIGIPKDIECKYSRYFRVCPDCRELWGSLTREFFLKAEGFMAEVDDD